MKKIIILLLLMASPISAGIYKWTDSDGNIHFGDRPIDSESATELNITINKNTGISNSSGNKKEREYLLKKIDEEKQEDAKKKSKRVAENKKRKQKCDYYRRKYQSHIQSNRTYNMSPDGERTYLSDEQRADRKRKLAKSVSRYCK